MLFYHNSHQSRLGNFDMIGEHEEKKFAWTSVDGCLISQIGNFQPYKFEKYHFHREFVYTLLADTFFEFINVKKVEWDIIKIPVLTHEI